MLVSVYKAHDCAGEGTSVLSIQWAELSVLQQARDCMLQGGEKAGYLSPDMKIYA